jgi:DNA-binding response OmpR family regulator
MARILVIDDEADVRSILAAGLKAHGHEVYLAENGNVGMDLQRRYEPDVVVTDVFMPEKDGLETIRELRVLYPSLGLIAISGGGKSASPDRVLSTARDMGAEVLQKPFSLDVLITTVDKLLPKSLKAADLLIAISEMERLLARSDAFDETKFVAIAELIIAQAPNEEVSALAQRIMRGKDRFGRRYELGRLDQNSLSDKVFRLKVTVEALNRVVPSPGPQADSSKRH